MCTEFGGHSVVQMLPEEMLFAAALDSEHVADSEK